MGARQPGVMESWAASAANEFVRPLGERWLHTLGVVERSRELARALPALDDDVLIAAAFVHDAGYAPRLARTGFHPVDGARYVDAQGHSRVAALVAHHGSADHEAEVRGLDELLAEFPIEQAVLVAALDFCDLSTGPRGERWSLSRRLADIAQRHADDSPVVLGLRAARSELEANFQRGRALLSSTTCS